jgi:hypothetical protein
MERIHGLFTQSMKTDKLLVEAAVEGVAVVTKAEVLALGAVATAIKVLAAVAPAEEETVRNNHQTNAKCPPTLRRNGIRFPQRNIKASKWNVRQTNAWRPLPRPEM